MLFASAAIRKLAAKSSVRVKMVLRNMILLRDRGCKDHTRLDEQHCHWIVTCFRHTKQERDRPTSIPPERLERPLFLCLLEPLIDFRPIDDVPPGSQVVGTLVLIFQIVSMLPNVIAQN